MTYAGYPVFDYDLWEPASGNWGGAERGTSPWDNIDFHVDLGCGRLKKARIGIDRFPDPGVNIVMDLDRLIGYGICQAPNEDAEMLKEPADPGRLPFGDGQIKSVISHHFLEHVGRGFVPLVDEVHRVLEPGGIFRAITPLFPSRTAVEDPDHRRYFMAGTWETFGGGSSGEHWHESFATPYTESRFEILETICTPAVSVEQRWGPEDAREIRCALRKR